MYMHICKCIIINIIIVMELWSFWFELTTVLTEWTSAVSLLFILYFILRKISKIFTSSVYFAPVTQTEQQYLFGSLKIFLDKC